MGGGGDVLGGWPCVGNGGEFVGHLGQVDEPVSRRGVGVDLGDVGTFEGEERTVRPREDATDRMGVLG